MNRILRLKKIRATDVLAGEPATTEASHGDRRPATGRRPLARVLGSVFAVVAVTTIGVAGPSAAASTDCPANRFCVWTDANYSGRMAYFSSGSADLRNAIGGYVFNNKVSSIWNRTGQHWCLYDGTGYTTRLLRQTPGGYRANLQVEGINDRTTSLRAC